MALRCFAIAMGSAVGVIVVAHLCSGIQSRPAMDHGVVDGCIIRSWHNVRPFVIDSMNPTPLMGDCCTPPRPTVAEFP